MRESVFFPIFITHLVSSEVCDVYKPIGYWLRENPGKQCEIVRGPFVLDASIGLSVDLIEPAFKNLTRIEGCIAMTKRSRLKNLKFLSSLKEIICDPEKAPDWGFDHTLHIKDDVLESMGLDSLEIVSGPGNILASFDPSDWTSWDDMLNMPNGVKCFSEKALLLVSACKHWAKAFCSRVAICQSRVMNCKKKEDKIYGNLLSFEIRFFAQHPQFTGLMWKNCKQENFCTVLRYFDDMVSIDDVPPNCTLFFGNIMINGLADIPILENLEILIGRIKIIGTFLADMSTFPSLRVIYYSFGRAYVGNTATQISGDVQLIVLVNTSFLVNFSIPTLTTDRKLDFEYTPPATIHAVESLLNPCNDYPKTQCVVNYNKILAENTSGVLAREFAACLIISTIGLLLLIRGTTLLLWLKPGSFLPSTRWMLGLIFVVLILVELERLGFYQRELPIKDEEGQNHNVYLPLLSSSQIISPLIEFYQRLCVVLKHAALAVFPLISLDYVIFNKVTIARTAKRCSHIFFWLSLLIFIVICCFFYPNLYTSIRIIEKLDVERVYGESQQFIILLVQDEGSSMKNRTVAGDVKVNPGDMIGTDVLGDVFSKYVWIVDGIFGYFFVILYSVKWLGYINAPLELLLLLYAHLSINRIRWYLKDFLIPNYCGNLKPVISYDGFWMDPNIYMCANGHIYQIGLMKLLEKMPHLSFLLVAIECFRFARAQLYVAHLLDHRRKVSILTLQSQHESVVSSSHFQ